MSTRRFYITTAIPYVNGDPHIGFALECVQADALARHRRLRGDRVRFLSGTDDNSLKNVEAADHAGVPVADYVEAKAQRFEALRGPLELSLDDFIRTSVDPRHRPGVERLWRACEASGDLYQRHYEGLYCVGCEAFLSPVELADGLCPEHGAAPQRVAERNWFFRLSRYQDVLLGIVQSGELRIEPSQRRNEVLGFIRSGLEDFSVSRSQERARGWGIPVPGDRSQVIYVWFDALSNYITALEYGTSGHRHSAWWARSDERVHVIGKGITRFHAVYWPAILLSAGEPLPSAIFVHDYLTVEGQKLSKSLATGAEDPVEITRRRPRKPGQIERSASSPASARKASWPARDAPRRPRRLERRSIGRPPPSTRRFIASTSRRQRARSGAWWTKATASSRRRGPGSSREPNGRATKVPQPSSTTCSGLSSPPATFCRESWSRSSPQPQRG